MNKNDIIKEVLMHRSRVAVKLSSVGNDIASRGRRHDNSYTGDVELTLINKIINDPDNKEHNMELLRAIHSKNNDYCPEYHDGIIGMDLVQLLEYIAEKVVQLDERKEKLSDNDYVNIIIGDISSKYSLSVDLACILSNTILYFLDRNAAILKSLQKNISQEASNYTYEIEEETGDGEK